MPMTDGAAVSEYPKPQRRNKANPAAERPAYLI